MRQTRRSGGLVLLSGMLLALVLGSVHAFSVLLEPLEARFAVSRASASMTYSLALACLTLGVLFGHRVYARLRPPLLATTVCLVAAAGCLLAATSTSLALLWFGYSLLFGAANGVGYGFALQISAQANQERQGLAMGLVTACYALGAALVPLPLELLLQSSGLFGALSGLGVALAFVAPLAAGLLMFAKAEFRVTVTGGEKLPARRHQTIVLWFGYGTAVAAGLMAIGHATGIARAADLPVEQVLAAPIVIAVFNMLGSLLGGRLADRIAVRQSLTLFPAISAAALAGLALFGTGFTVLAGLAVIGFAYGATITVYPAAIATLFGAEAGVRIYGRVFTAWGLAGLLAPWLAGLIFAQSGNYKIALLAAGCSAVSSVALIFLLPAAPSIAGPAASRTDL